MTPTVPDGPDTELAAAIANLRRGTEIRLAALKEGRVSVGTGRRLVTIVRAMLARPDGAPQHLVQGDRVETADGVRATVTGPAPRGPHGEPAVNLDWDGDAGGPAYEHDLRRVVGARPAAGRDLTADDVRLALVGMGYYLPVSDAHYAVANYLNVIARPTAPAADATAPDDLDPIAVSDYVRDALLAQKHYEGRFNLGIVLDEVRGMFGPGDGVGQDASRVDWGGYEPSGYYDRRSISELIARSSLGCPNVPNCGRPIGDHHVDDWNLDGDPINPRCP